MNWKSFIFGAAIGMVGTYTAREVLLHKKISPEKVLEHVKEEFKKQGSINGSWIHIEIEPYKKENIHYHVYKGGISKNESGVNKQYEFIVDASSGTIIDSYPLS